MKLRCLAQFVTDEDEGDDEPDTEHEAEDLCDESVEASENEYASQDGRSDVART